MNQKLKRRMCIALIVILVASFFAWGIQTSFRRVRVRDMYLVTSQQQLLHALAYIPRNASADNKLPCVVTGHGGFHCAEMQDAACVELSRRGFVVIAVDMYSHGMSSNVPNFMVDSIFAGNGMGIGDMVDYVMNGNMDFIDLDRVGIMGHSMGTMACGSVISGYTAKYQAAIEAAQLPDSDGGEEITPEEQAAADAVVEIKAAFCEGINPNTLEGTWANIHGINVEFVFGMYEELGNTNSTGNGYLLNAPEALEMINSSGETVTQIENGRYYGNKQDNTVRVLYQPNTTHLTDFIAPSVTAECIKFFTNVFNVQATIAPTNQVYLIKQLFNFAAFIGFFCLIIPFVDMLLTTPAFITLRPEEEKKSKYALGKNELKIGIIAVTVFSFVAFLISNAIDTKAVLFKPGPMSNAKWFPINEANIVMVWMVIFALLNIALIAYSLSKAKKSKEEVRDILALDIDGSRVLRTLGIVAATIGLLYATVYFCKWMFNVDFRFWKVAVKQFNNEKLIYFLEYLPSYILFMLTLSVLTNGLWCTGECNENKRLAVIGLAFALGGIIAWILQYGKLFIGGTVLWSNMNGVASVALKNWVVFLAPFMLRKCYKLTGKNWVGPVTLSVLYTLIAVSTTTVQNAML